MVNVSVGLVAHNKAHITKTVGDNSVMSSATDELAGDISFLKFVAIALEFMCFDYL